MQQALDFRDESEALYTLLRDLSDDDLATPTAFKGWTINQVLRHLHVWNQGADLSLTQPKAFKQFMASLSARMAEGGQLPDFEAEHLEGLSGRRLLAAWHDYLTAMTDRFAAADPSMRVKWAGPDMSVRSSITARLMETWAHGQEVYDVLGQVRENTDRIRNIVVLGVNTYGWTFAVRDEQAPQPVPHLVLTAPSGEEWQYNEVRTDERIEGTAEAFCQVVTQVRNIADTNLKVTGPNAQRWMANAQCFAGAASEPPPPGTRFTRK